MNIVRGYSFIVVTILIYWASNSTSEASSLFQRTLLGVMQLELNGMIRDMTCRNNEECLSTQKCIGEECEEICPGSCGTDALCYAQNHEENCSCARCYVGNPRESCRPYPGIMYWKCLISE